MVRSGTPLPDSFWECLRGCGVIPWFGALLALSVSGFQRLSVLQGVRQSLKMKDCPAQSAGSTQVSNHWAQLIELESPWKASAWVVSPGGIGLKHTP